MVSEVWRGALGALTSPPGLASHGGVPRLPFAKYQGLGNDFIVVEGTFITPAAAARLCHRRRGIGADGVLTVLPPRHPEAAARMHVYNADGSVAEMCGNGLRCVVRHLLAARGGDRVAVDTDAGVLEGWRDGEDIAITLGEARLISDAIPGCGPRGLGLGISMGNPHLVLPPAAHAPRPDAEAHGPGLERHPDFPQRVNVGFPELLGPHHLRLVVFERGSGITDACGTGAGAAVTALTRAGHLEPGAEITVELPGGPLRVRLTGDPRAEAAPGAALARVIIAGEAVRVYEGAVDLAVDELADHAG